VHHDDIHRKGVLKLFVLIGAMASPTIGAAIEVLSTFSNSVTDLEKISKQTTRDKTVRNISHSRPFKASRIYMEDSRSFSRGENNRTPKFPSCSDRIVCLRCSPDVSTMSHWLVHFSRVELVLHWHGSLPFRSGLQSHSVFVWDDKKTRVYKTKTWQHISSYTEEGALLGSWDQATGY